MNACLEGVIDSTREHGDRSVEEEARQSDEVQPRHRGRQPLVILGQPPKARRPREIALHHPPPRQKHEAPLGLRPLDHLQPNAMLLRCLGRLLPGVPLVYVGQLYRLTGRLLHGLGQLLHLRPVLL
jgi:hypothetical protein